MNFKKLQAMQLELENSILSAKPKMTAEERFNKTLVALSVEVAEVANAVEHFKFWKDNKGKVDSKRFVPNWDYGGNQIIGYYDYNNGAPSQISFEQAHELTLVEECSDALHFLLSIANQLCYEIDSYYNELPNSETLESLFLNINFQVTTLQRYDASSSEVDKVQLQCLINNYFQYIEKLGITTQELEQAYYDKNKVNYERLREGY